MTLYRKIEEGERRWIERLKEFVAIKSVSGDPKLRGEVRNMIEHVKKVCFKLYYIKRNTVDRKSSIHIYY